MKRKLTALLAAAALCLSLTIPASAAGSFADVSPTRDAWCYTQVMQASEAGLMNGYGSSLFGKNDPITRGQMVQILYNYYGEDCGTNSGFSDVPSSVWYAKAVTWASKKGVASGYSNGTFGPDNQLTREQMVTILYNVAGRPATNTSALSQFNDRGQVAAYAVNGFSWAVSNKVVSGTSNTTLSPRGTATRAQVAVILIRYLENVEGVQFPEVNGGSTQPVEPTPTPTPTKPDASNSQNSDGATNAAYVNSLCDVGKSNDYPTTGDASSPNANGFYTKANVDISGAKLQYDVIPYVNAFLAKHPDQIDETWDVTAHWVTTDEQEEYTLLRAKEAYSYFEHARPDGSDIISGENLYRGNSGAEVVIKAWENSSGHASIMLNAGCKNKTICVASCNGVWVMTIWGDINYQFVLKTASNNYFVK